MTAVSFNLTHIIRNSQSITRVVIVTSKNSCESGTAVILVRVTSDVDGCVRVAVWGRILSESLEYEYQNPSKRHGKQINERNRKERQKMLLNL